MARFAEVLENLQVLFGASAHPGGDAVSGAGADVPEHLRWEPEVSEVEEMLSDLLDLGCSFLVIRTGPV